MKVKIMRIMLLILFPALAVLPARPADAQETGKPDITAGADRERVNIGDRIKLDITSERSGEYDLIFPETPEELGDFSFVSSRTIRSGRRYVLGIYTTGTHVIPPVKVMYRPKGAEGWSYAESPQVPIEVESLLTGEESDIRDLKGLVPMGGVFPAGGVLALLLAAAAALFWYLNRRRKTAGAIIKEAMKTPHEIAYEQLRELRSLDLPDRGLVKEYYSRLSDIIRRYLENRFRFRAPEMTTEEFMETARRSPELTVGQKGLLEEFLSHCDMVKFARYGPTKLEMLDSFRSAEKFVDETREEETSPEEQEVEA